MKLITALVLLFAGVVSSFAAKLKIITTLADLASIAQAVGGDRVSVSSIINGVRDPHRLEAKPSYMSRASSADLWVAVGLELELGYEPPILEGSGNAKIQRGRPGYVAVADWVPVLEKPTGTVTRAQGDLHPYGNPHVWLDPYNGRIIAEKLAERMGQLDRAAAGYFEENAKKFVRRLDEAMWGAALVNKFGGDALWQWDNQDKLVANLTDKGALNLLGGWAAKMRPFWQQPIVTYHRSWVYFAYRFGLKIVAELEPKPGIDPTPGHIASVMRVMQDRKVKAILQEPFYSTKSGEFVAGRTGASLVIAPGSVAHDPSVKDYIGLFDLLVSKVSAALGR